MFFTQCSIHCSFESKHTSLHHVTLHSYTIHSLHHTTFTVFDDNVTEAKKYVVNSKVSVRTQHCLNQSHINNKKKQLKTLKQPRHLITAHIPRAHLIKGHIRFKCHGYISPLVLWTLFALQPLSNFGWDEKIHPGLIIIQREGRWQP